MKTSCGNEDTGQLCGVNSVHNQLLYVLELTPTKGVVKVYVCPRGISIKCTAIGVLRKWYPEVIISFAFT